MNSRRPRAGLAVRAWPLRRNGLRFGSGVQPVAVSRPVPVRYGDCETRTPLFCARADPARGTHGRGCSGARSGLEERRLSWWSDGVAGRARGNPCRIRTPICGRLDTRGNPGFRSRPTVGPPPTGKDAQVRDDTIAGWRADPSLARGGVTRVLSSSESGLVVRITVPRPRQWCSGARRGKGGNPRGKMHNTAVSWGASIPGAQHLALYSRGFGTRLDAVAEPVRPERGKGCAWQA